MVSIPNMLEENIDYELIPDDGEHWHIRIKEGDFIETVFSFGKITVDEKNHQMKYNFTIHFTPDEDVHKDNIDFQKYAGKVLESIMINNINEMEKK